MEQNGGKSKPCTLLILHTALLGQTEKCTHTEQNYWSLALEQTQLEIMKGWQVNPH